MRSTKAAKRKLVICYIHHILYYLLFILFKITSAMIRCTLLQDIPR